MLLFLRHLLEIFAQAVRFLITSTYRFSTAWCYLRRRDLVSLSYSAGLGLLTVYYHHDWQLKYSCKLIGVEAIRFSAEIFASFLLLWYGRAVKYTSRVGVGVNTYTADGWVQSEENMLCHHGVTCSDACTWHLRDTWCAQMSLKINIQYFHQNINRFRRIVKRYSSAYGWLRGKYERAFMHSGSKHHQVVG